MGKTTCFQDSTIEREENVWLRLQKGRDSFPM